MRKEPEDDPLQVEKGRLTQRKTPGGDIKERKIFQRERKRRKEFLHDKKKKKRRSPLAQSLAVTIFNKRTKARGFGSPSKSAKERYSNARGGGVFL